MAFQKGHKRFGGREKGQTDEKVREARKLFVEILEKQTDHMEDALDKVREKDPSKYLDVMSRLAQYFVPKMLDHNVSMDAGINISINKTIGKPSK